MLDEPSDLDPLDEAIDEFLTLRQSGENLTISEFCTRHTDLQTELRELLPTLVMLEDSKPESAESEAPPPELMGDFSLEAELGRGGMGVVYRATQQSLGRTVALKILSGRWATDEVAMKRFRREAQAAANLHHTNIVPVYEVGEFDSHCYYAMQLIEGTSLDKLIADLAESSESRNPRWRELLTSAFEASSLHIPVREAASDTAVRRPVRDYFRAVAYIGVQAADALAYAHARDIIHRDIKPSNLLFDQRGVVWITDFGLAKTDTDAMTRDGDVLGTLCYMSPERFRQQCDARADVYALGQTLYELLTCKLAFPTSDRLQLINLIAEVEPKTPREHDPSIPRDLETVVLKAMEKDPEARYQSADEFSADLRRFMDDLPVEASRITPVGRVLRWARRNQLVAGLVAAVACLLLAVTAVSTFSASSYRRQSEEIRSISSVAQDRLSEVLRLSDAHHLRDLLQREKQLWPAVPDKVPAMRAWLEEAEELVDRLPDYRDSLETLRGLAENSQEASSNDPIAARAAGDELRLLLTEREKVRQQLQQFPEQNGKAGFTTLRRSASKEYTHPAHTAHYFRKRITRGDIADGTRMRLKLWADDGAIVYVNGVEAYRFNLPEGQVAHNSVSLHAMFSDIRTQPKEHVFESPLSAGENLIAVEVHQSDYNSSDAYFDLELTADNEQLISRGAVWEYFDQGTPPSGWNQLQEAVAEWPSGAAPLGYGFPEPRGRLLEIDHRIAELKGQQSPKPKWVFADPSVQWQHDSLTEMVRCVEQLTEEGSAQGALTSVRKRLEFASTIEQRSILDHQSEWRAACRSIADPAECPQYNGLDIKPQVGLVPVGRDPWSGLWEFAHLETGSVPERADGKLQITEQSGLVFVLLPGGAFRMGAQPPRFGARVQLVGGRWEAGPIQDDSVAKVLGVQEGDGIVSILGSKVTGPEVIGEALKFQAAGSEVEVVVIRGGVEQTLRASLPSNTDAFAGNIEQPIQEVILAPFFLSKYEMTQGQWQRVADGNPSLWEPGIVFGGILHTLLHPVENATWTEFSDIVERRLGLLLPTEAQWEYAARAGTDTMWWVGNTSRDLAGQANLADKTAQNYPNFSGLLFEEWLEDGYVLHAPVDQFGGNPFGIHGTVGNVSEWCRDHYSQHPDILLSDETGQKIQLFDNRLRAIRGGHHQSLSLTGRSSARVAGQATYRAATVGVRPARAIDR